MHRAVASADGSITFEGVTNKQELSFWFDGQFVIVSADNAGVTDKQNISTGLDPNAVGRTVALSPPKVSKSVLLRLSKST